MNRLRASPRVPVLMPLVDVQINQEGQLSVQVDREPYSVDVVLQRADLQRVLGQIAAELGTPVRVEVREADDSTFTDIVTPPDAPARAVEAPTRVAGKVAEGFVPNEEVSIAFVVASQVASSDGTARLRLPPALLAAHHGEFVLLGRTSGTIQISDGLSL